MKFCPLHFSPLLSNKGRVHLKCMALCNIKLQWSSEANRLKSFIKGKTQFMCHCWITPLSQLAERVLFTKIQQTKPASLYGRA